MNSLNDTDKIAVLFICRNNSVRSQMAEAILNSVCYKTHIAFSGGTDHKNIHENTIKVLKEIKIDISNKKSKNVEIYKNMTFDHVITLCDDDKCPYFPSTTNYINKKFKDPQDSLEEYYLDSFREVRDEIKKWIIEIVKKGII